MDAGGLRRLLLVMIGTPFSRRLSNNLFLNITPRLSQGYPRLATKVTLRLIRFLNSLNTAITLVTVATIGTYSYTALSAGRFPALSAGESGMKLHFLLECYCTFCGELFSEVTKFSMHPVQIQ